MAEPSDTIFVGDVPAVLEESYVLQIFGAYGTIKSHKLLAPANPSSGKRAVIFSFATVAEAKWIVDNLHGNIPQGLSEPITVNYKRPTIDKGKGADAKGGCGACGACGNGCGCGGGWGKATDKGWGGCGGCCYGACEGGKGDWGSPYGAPPPMAAPALEDPMQVPPHETLFIGELPGTLDEAKLLSVFEAYGTIKSHRLLEPTSFGKRAAIITFGTLSEAKWIVDNLDGNMPQGLSEPIKVSYKRNSGKGSEKGCCKGAAGAWSPEGGGMLGYDSYSNGGSMGGYGMSGGDSGDADMPSENVFIGELPGTMDEAQFLTVFGAYGTIKSHKLLESTTQGKRAAIVTFGSVDEAVWVVNNLNGNIPQGLTDIIKVNYKRPGKSAGKGDFYGKGGGKCSIHAVLEQLFASGSLPGNAKLASDEGGSLFVGGLPRDTTDFELYQMFAVFGPLAPRGVTAMPAPDGMSCKGYGFVNFLTPEAAHQAHVILNGTLLPDGSQLKVTPKRDRSGDSGGGGGKDWGKGKGYSGW